MWFEIGFPKFNTNGIDELYGNASFYTIFKSDKITNVDNYHR